jgi:hypothetical protein
MSDQPIEGTVRPGPPPADAVRPQTVIRGEDGEIVGAVVHLPDGTVVEVTAPDPASIGPVFIEPGPWRYDVGAFKLDWRMRQSFGAHLIDPRDLIRITGA